MNQSFDGDVFDDESSNDQKSSDFAQLLEASFKRTHKKLSVGDKIHSEILVLGKEEVYVSTGVSGKSSEGIVSRRDLIEPDGTLKYSVGDSLDLYVTQIRGSEIYLSPKSTSKNLANDLEDAFDMMLPIEGKVVEVCKGGVRVLIRGKLAFCPISQLDFARTETGEEFVGKKLEFRITQFAENGRNIVVSRRKLLEDQRDLSQGSFAEEHREGEILTGKVKRIETYGAFVEVAPGIEGLLHVSELSWTRVTDPSEIVKVGEEVRVKVLKTESKEGRLKVSLSLKQVGPEPWDHLSSEIKEGGLITGKVTRCMKFGAFVEIAPGIEGLIPLSEMSFKKRVMNAEEFVKVGDRVTVVVKEIQREAKRISLSLKDAASKAESDDNATAMSYASQSSMGSFGTLADKLKNVQVKKKG